MAPIITAAVARLKQDVQRFLSIACIAQVANELGLVWKQTPLAVPQLVAHFARQILGGNLAMPELARQAGSRFTPEAYCTARGRLPLALLQELLARTWALAPAGDVAARLWKGHRLWHVDGSSFSMPDTPELQQRFGQPKAQRQGCGFPVAHLLCLFDAATGLIRQCVVSPLYTHDLTHARLLHPQMQPGDIVIADRAFESFAHLAQLRQQGLHAVLPVHQKRQVDFVKKERRTGRHRRRVTAARLRRCGRSEQITRWHKPAECPAYLSRAQYAALPASIDVREIKRVVRLPNGQRQALVLITTLLDAKAYPAADLLALLKDRWQVEVNLRHLKQTMRMAILRSQSGDGIAKELHMFLIVYNLVRLIMLEAAQRQQVAVRRISFADALFWLRHGNLAADLPPLEVLPDRPGRIEPRVIKRRKTTYKLMRKPRKVLQNELREGKS